MHSTLCSYRPIRRALVLASALAALASIIGAEPGAPEHDQRRTPRRLEEHRACVEPGATLDLLTFGWMHETHRQGRGFTKVRHTADGKILIDLDLQPGDEGRCAGEVFFELESLPCITGTVDLIGAQVEISYEVDKDLLNGPTTSAQIFIQTENGDGETAKQYSQPRPIDDLRNKLTLKPTMLKRLGHTDPGLDLHGIVAVGFKLFLGEGSRRGYDGTVTLSRVTLTLADEKKRNRAVQEIRKKKYYEKDEDSRISETCRETGLPKKTPPWEWSTASQLPGELEAGNNVVKVGPRSLPGTEATGWRVDVRFEGHADSVFGRTAEVRYALSEEFDASDKKITLGVLVDKRLRGNLARPNWVHVALEDRNCRTMTGPGVIVSERACQWKEVAIRPTVRIPMPLGSVEDGFDMEKIKAIRIKFELGRFWHEIYRLEFASPDILTGTFHISPPLVAKSPSPPSALKEKELEQLPECERSDEPIPRNKFIVGVNYPWIHYGWDIGRNPTGDRKSCGFDTQGRRLRGDFRRLNQAGVDVVRVFLLGDLRTGVVFDNGVARLDNCVTRDLRQLFGAAADARLKLMLVLLDYKVADGVRLRDRGRPTKAADCASPRIDARDVKDRCLHEALGKELWKEGERQQVIVDQTSRKIFVEQALRPLLREIRVLNETYGALHSIDLANEIGNSAAIITPAHFPEVENFVSMVAAVAREELPKIPLTLGTRSMPDLWRYWRSAPVDIRQFHYYDSFLDDGLPSLEQSAACLFKKPIIVGELDPTGDLYCKLKTVYEAGYAGALFWSMNGRDGFTVDLSAIRRWKNGGTNVPVPQ